MEDTAFWVEILETKLDRIWKYKKVYFMKQNADLNRHQCEQDDSYEDTAFHLSFRENWIHKI